MLSKKENRRYNRHLILDQVGMEGQLKLKRARVLVVGAGGLGCPILQYLAAAGVGKIGIVDFDEVDLSNLQRQVLFNEADLGKNKAQCAAEHLREMNPEVEFEVFPIRLSASNALDLFAQFDLVVDGSDNFETRYLVSDAAIVTDIPLVYGSIYKFQGQVSVFNWKGGPSYRCLFPDPPEDGAIQNCAEIGVIGVLPGVIGAQQANEVLKIILEIGEPLSGKLLIYDALKASYTSISFKRSEAEIEKVLNRKGQFADFDYAVFCGVQNQSPSYEIKVADLRSYLNREEIRIIDLREPWEEPELIGTNVERIVMGELLEKIDRFQTEKKIVLVCQTGTRSGQVRILLAQKYGIDDIVELTGGMQHYGSI